jgi:hypothetical protein
MSADPQNSLRPGALAGLTLGAIGVVYGDIGTSPLYALKEVFAHGRVPLTPENILGILSLVFWTLTVVVTLKYVTLILRADNNGEGGLIAMLALASQAVKHRPVLRARLLLVGIFGTAIFFGDGVITPAVSVLGAVEGLEVAAPGLHRFVVPVTLVVLTLLFAAQRFGTAVVGRLFGPVTLVWFGVLAVLGGDAHPAQPGRAGGAAAHACAGLHAGAPRHRLRGAGCGRAVRHRGRSAVCRPGPLRQASHPAGLVCGGHAGAVAELLRPGCDAAAAPGKRAQPVLRDGAVSGRCSRSSGWPRWRR